MKTTSITVMLAAALCMLSAILLGGQSETYDLIIANGRIVDGSGNPWFYRDIAIRGDQIVGISRFNQAQAKQYIDARGLVVAPGFIDMLGDSAIHLLIDPRAESKVYQGITTVVTGEGHSVAPMNDHTAKEGLVLSTTIKRFNVTVNWQTLGEYFARLERDHTAINLASSVGACQVRQYVLREENRAPIASELAQMRRLVAQAMEDGAIGLSTSLIYPPGAYAKTEELIELAKVSARYGGIYLTHMRNEGDSIMEALDEAIRIGKEAGIPVEVHHLKMAGKQNWGKMGAVIKRIEEARSQGLDITADQYPYIAASTGLDAIVPPWAQEGGSAKFIERLKDPSTREKLRREIRTPSSSWDNNYLGVGGGEGVLIASVPNQGLAKYEGKRLPEIARMMGKIDELDAAFDLLISSGGRISTIYFLMNEDDLRLAIRQPWISFCTDGAPIATTGPLAILSKLHPRTYGSYPRVLGRYMRDEKILTLEEAIRKMTSQAANRIHLNNRGLLKAGFFADVVVFDPQQIRDLATYETPNQLSAGMRYVIVNGQLVLDDGKQTKALPGRPLRGPGYKEKK